ncbi:unnamed protein product, partial [Polarella glacialis]
AMDPSKVVKALLETTEGAWDFINADNIWPYYDRTVHGIFCRHLPRTMALVWLVTSIVGLIFCPILTLMVSNHLSIEEEQAQGKFGKNWSDAALGRASFVADTSASVESRLNSLVPREQALVLKRLLHSRDAEVTSRLEELSDDADSDQQNIWSKLHSSTFLPTGPEDQDSSESDT